jgi:hypothetical protein
MGLFDIFKRKQTVDLVAKRLEYLNRFGRITDGEIIDSEMTEAGEVVYYTYNVHGANYESSEILSVERTLDPLKYAPGAKVGVRYDPKQHANSILV